MLRLLLYVLMYEYRRNHLQWFESLEKLSWRAISLRNYLTAVSDSLPLSSEPVH